MTITQERIKLLFSLVDGKLIWKNIKSKKSRASIGDEAGWIGVGGYREVGVDGKTYKAHRLVFLFVHGSIPEMIDHINGNNSDNRIENLRECTGTQNQHNRKVRHDSKSGLKCVIWDKAAEKWQVRISLNGKRHFLGLFNSIFDAACVAIPARERLHGAFCCNGLRG